MSLVFDARNAVGANAGLHALLVGVSAYPYLQGGPQAVPEPWGMPQLSSTASTADRILQWLRQAQLPVPLATCRMLLSPSANEAHLPHGVQPATMPNVIQAAAAWRNDASTNADNMTFFYFAGHGVQRTKEDAVLCLTDFLQPNFPELFHAVDVASLRGGMSPSPARPNIARTQFYFIDACRLQPEQLLRFEPPLKTSFVFQEEIGGRDDRCSPVFYAAVPNHPAAAIAGQQTVFSLALLQCLAGAAGDSLGEDAAGNQSWGVSLSGLNRGLRFKFAELNRALGGNEIYTVGGSWAPGPQAAQTGGETPVCFLTGPPQVDVSVLVDPQEARQFGGLRVLADGNLEKVRMAAPLAAPLRQRLSAGFYSVEVSFNPPTPPYVDRTKFMQARAPQSDWKVTVV